MNHKNSAAPRSIGADADRSNKDRNTHSVAGATAGGRILASGLETAQILNVSPGTVENLRRRGELPSLKIGARRLFALADILAFVEARKGASRHE